MQIKFKKSMATEKKRKNQRGVTNINKEVELEIIEYPKQIYKWNT